jgi:hypothetical protein
MLHDMSASTTTSVMLAQVVSSSTSPLRAFAPTKVKTEEFTTILEHITESFVLDLPKDHLACRKAVLNRTTVTFAIYQTILVTTVKSQQITLSKANVLISSTKTKKNDIFAFLK